MANPATWRWYNLSTNNEWNCPPFLVMILTDLNLKSLYVVSIVPSSFSTSFTVFSFTVIWKNLYFYILLFSPMLGSFHLSTFVILMKNKKISCTVFAWKWQLILVTSDLSFASTETKFIKPKNQLYCTCLKMTADFGNFLAKTDKKQQTKDEMKQTKHDQLEKRKEEKKGNTGPCRFVYCLWRGGFLLDQWAPAAPLELKSCLSFVSARAFSAAAATARRRMCAALSAHAHHTKHKSH